MRDSDSFYETSNFRLASALIAHGKFLIGIKPKTDKDVRKYVFANERDIRTLACKINMKQDYIASYKIYNSVDLLTKEILKSQYQEEFKIILSDNLIQGMKYRNYKNSY